jgi:hypothetical protein
MASGDKADNTSEYSCLVSTNPREVSQKSFNTSGDFDLQAMAILSSRDLKDDWPLQKVEKTDETNFSHSIRAED